MGPIKLAKAAKSRTVLPPPLEMLVYASATVCPCHCVVDIYLSCFMSPDIFGLLFEDGAYKIS